MPEVYYYLFFLVVFFLLELLYFRIAGANKIIDRPNERSSHQGLVIRGGGIIFPVSVLCWFILNGFPHPYFVSGLLLISAVSFLDDLHNLHSRTRFFFQWLAVSVLFFSFSLTLSWYWYIPVLILVTGFINAYNFMDGINGITATYSLITIGTLFYINHFELQFTSEPLLIFIMLSLVVFSFFNFRALAKCFAGDVGSIGMAFIISYLVVELILNTNNFLFIGFLMVYGLDTVTTIVFRLLRKENIFRAHRSHFYQFLSNEMKIGHLSVSLMYSLAQLAINIFILYLFENNSALNSGSVSLLVLMAVSAVVFLLLRFRLEGPKHLLGIGRSVSMKTG